MSRKSINFLSYIVKSGLFVLPVLALIVSSSLFFPFITGKNFFFRTVVEILFFLWVALAVFDKNYRPRKSPLLFALAAFLIIISLAGIFGENFYRSFWSNFERMEGLVSHLHFFAYFLILSSVFKKKDFKWLFAAMILTSVIISIYAYLQFAGKVAVHQGGTKLDATLGNSTYLAIYIIFHLFLLGWFFVSASNVWLRACLAFLFVFELPIVYYTMTRGAVLGFAGALILFTFLMGILSRAKKVRYYFFGALAVFLAVAALFVVFKDSRFVRGKPTLDKIASISLTQGTVESRLTIWKMSLEAFKENPVLGSGPENFNLVFNKYFKPNMWKQEPWFDRAHNIIFDWLTAAGILGFLAYWSVFLAALYMIWKGVSLKNGGAEAASGQFLKNPRVMQAALFTSLFAAYGFHNLFVFDNLTSYYLFFSILAYIHFNYVHNNSLKDNEKDNNFYNGQNNLSVSEIGISQYILITASFIIAVFGLYFVNLKPYLAGKQLLFALQTTSQTQDIDVVLNEFKKSISYRTFGSAEAREQLSAFASNVAGAEQVSPDKKQKIVSEAIKEMEEQVKAAPDDARFYIFLGTLYARSGRTDDAMATFQKAHSLSPKKQQIYFLISDIHLAKGENEAALKIMQEAYDLDRAYDEAAKNLAVVMILNKKEKEAEDLLQNMFGKRLLADTQFVNAYARAGNFKMVKEIWLKIIEKEPNNPQYRVSLAASHLQLSERQDAIKQLEKAIELAPEFKQQGEYFINEIRAGRNP